MYIAASVIPPAGGAPCAMPCTLAAKDVVALVHQIAGLDRHGVVDREKSGLVWSRIIRGVVDSSTPPTRKEIDDSRIGMFTLRRLPEYIHLRISLRVEEKLPTWMAQRLPGYVRVSYINGREDGERGYAWPTRVRGIGDTYTYTMTFRKCRFSSTVKSPGAVVVID